MLICKNEFQQFLEQQFCAENINFYVAVEEYRSIPDNEVRSLFTFPHKNFLFHLF